MIIVLGIALSLCVLIPLGCLIHMLIDDFMHPDPDWVKKQRADAKEHVKQLSRQYREETRRW